VIGEKELRMTERKLACEGSGEYCESTATVR
jgi:hypothetical protein